MKEPHQHLTTQDHIDMVAVAAEAQTLRIENQALRDQNRTLARMVWLMRALVIDLDSDDLQAIVEGDL